MFRMILPPKMPTFTSTLKMKAFSLPFNGDQKGRIGSLLIQMHLFKEQECNNRMLAVFMSHVCKICIMTLILQISHTMMIHKNK